MSNRMRPGREDVVRQARRMAEWGMSYPDIGAVLGLSKSAVCQIAWRNHFPKRRRRQLPAPCRLPPQVACEGFNQAG